MDANIRTVGYITPAIFTSYFRLLLAGVQRATHERNVRLVIFQMTNGDVMRSLPYWHDIDGWVTCFSSSHTEQFYDPDRTTVNICEPHGDAPVVLIDNFGGMRACVAECTEFAHDDPSQSPLAGFGISWPVVRRRL